MTWTSWRRPWWVGLALSCSGRTRNASGTGSWRRCIVPDHTPCTPEGGACMESLTPGWTGKRNYNVQLLCPFCHKVIYVWEQNTSLFSSVFVCLCVMCYVLCFTYHVFVYGVCLWMCVHVCLKLHVHMCMCVCSARAASLWAVAVISQYTSIMYYVNQNYIFLNHSSLAHQSIW